MPRIADKFDMNARVFADDGPSPRQQLLIAVVFAGLAGACLLAVSFFCGYLGARTPAQMDRLNYLAQSWMIAFILCIAASVTYLLRSIRAAWFDLSES